MNRLLSQCLIAALAFTGTLPLLGALVFALVGLWVRGRVDETTRAEIATRLQTVLHANINALRLWFTEREYDAKSLASDLRVQAAITELEALAKETNAAALALADSAAGRGLRLQAHRRRGSF